MENLKNRVTYIEKLGNMSSIELGMGILYGCKEFGFDDNQLNLLESAILLSSTLHSKQVRKSRNEKINPPYIEHPLRNTLRIIRWGIFDLDILLGSIFHDIVEDSSDVYCEIFLGKSSKDEELNKQKLLSYINKVYGDKVHYIVKAVTNPNFTGSKEDKNLQYLNHVKKEIKNPNVLLVKLSDFVDNAVGLKYSNDKNFIEKQKVKYFPLFDIFLEELSEQAKFSNLIYNNLDKIKFSLEYGKVEYK